jgi:1-acyl-sn-glycerol-3-phosphate acyltransferase
LYSIPLLGTHLRRAGHLPVDRSNARASLKSMMEAARIISGRGVSVLNFPEGGRSLEGLHEFKEGPAYIAIKAGVPVVPVAIVGMRELLPMGSIHLRSGRVVLRVGDPIETKGMDTSQRGELTERLHREVAALMG